MRANRDLAHKWIHKLKPRGKCGNVSFEGPLYRSYSTTIAEIYQVPKGPEIVVFNERSYSVTTSGHQGAVRCAIPEEIPVVLVEDGHRGSCWDGLVPRGDDIKKWAIEEITRSLKIAGGALARSKRARTRADWSLNIMAKYMENAERINTYFKCRMKMPDMEHLAEALEQARKREAVLERKRQAKLEAEKREKVESWLKGEPGSHYPYGISEIRLRVKLVDHIEGDTVPAGTKLIETSRSATIPYEDGEKCFRFAMLKREHGWKRNGEQFPIGEFKLDAVNEFGIIAGCHHISWTEIERFAKQEGWIA
jgi:hypothetical protein